MARRPSSCWFSALTWFGADPDPVQQHRRQTLGLIEQREQQMFFFDLRMAALRCEFLCSGQRLLGAFGKSLYVHASVLRISMPEASGRDEIEQGELPDLYSSTPSSAS